MADGGAAPVVLLQISWDNGNSAQLSVLNGGSSLQTGNLTLYRVNPADQGLRGTYGYSTYVDTSGAGGSGDVSGDHALTFNGDGTFSATNFVGSANQGSRSGRYSINGYILQLTYDDGTTERHILFLYGDGSLAIDGTTYSPRS